jgi:hypothetical protein
MAAPPGFNPNQSMLPDGGGTIHAMRGGGMGEAPPHYNAGASMIQLTPNVESATILAHKGGVRPYTVRPPDMDPKIVERVVQASDDETIRRVIALSLENEDAETTSKTSAETTSKTSAEASAKTGDVAKRKRESAMAQIDILPATKPTIKAEQIIAPAQNLGPNQKDVIVFGNTYRLTAIMTTDKKETIDSIQEDASALAALEEFGLDKKDQEIRQQILRALYSGKCNTDSSVSFLSLCEPIRIIIRQLALDFHTSLSTKPISTTAQEMVEQAQDAIEEAASVAKSALTEAAGAVKRGVRVHKKEETKDEKMKRLANTQGEIVEIAGREEEAKTEIERLLAEKAKVNAKLATEDAKVTKLAREAAAANRDKTSVDAAIASQKHVQDRIALTTALLTETQPALDALERHVNELKKAVADHAENLKKIKSNELTAAQQIQQVDVFAEIAEVYKKSMTPENKKQMEDLMAQIGENAEQHVQHLRTKQAEMVQKQTEKDRELARATAERDRVQAEKDKIDHSVRREEEKRQKAEEERQAAEQRLAAERERASTAVHDDRQREIDELQELIENQEMRINELTAAEKQALDEKKARVADLLRLLQESASETARLAQEATGDLITGNLNSNADDNDAGTRSRSGSSGSSGSPGSLSNGSDSSSGSQNANNENAAAAVAATASIENRNGPGNDPGNDATVRTDAARAARANAEAKAAADAAVARAAADAAAEAARAAAARVGVANVGVANVAAVVAMTRENVGYPNDADAFFSIERFNLLDILGRIPGIRPDKSAHFFKEIGPFLMDKDRQDIFAFLKFVFEDIRVAKDEEKDNKRNYDYYTKFKNYGKLNKNLKDKISQLFISSDGDCFYYSISTILMKDPSYSNIVYAILAILYFIQAFHSIEKIGQILDNIYNPGGGLLASNVNTHNNMNRVRLYGLLRNYVDDKDKDNFQNAILPVGSDELALLQQEIANIAASEGQTPLERYNGVITWGTDHELKTITTLIPSIVLLTSENPIDMFNKVKPEDHMLYSCLEIPINTCDNWDKRGNHFEVLIPTPTEQIRGNFYQSRYGPVRKLILPPSPANAPCFSDYYILASQLSDTPVDILSIKGGKSKRKSHRRKRVSFKKSKKSKNKTFKK